MSGWRAALVAAVVGGLILGVGAFVTREQPGPPGTATSIDESGASLTCAPAIEPVCRTLAGQLGVPYSAEPVEQGVLIVADGATVVGFDEVATLSSTPVVIGVWTERASVLSARGCEGELDLDCLLGHLGTRWDAIGGRAEWGEIRLGMANPAAGPAELAAWRVVAHPEIAPELTAGLRLRATDEADLLDTLALRGPAATDAVIATEAALVARWDSLLLKRRISFVYPDPGPFIDYVVLASGRKGRELADRLLSPDLSAVLGSLGVRPASGAAPSLHEAMGEPGGRLPELTPAEQEALEKTW